MSIVEKTWFLIKTATTFKKGTRFRDGDRPNEKTFRNLLDTLLGKADSNDRAKEDTGEFNKTTNGHVVLATDTQAKTLEAQKGDRSLVVQPHQTTTNSTKEDEIIGDYEGAVLETLLDGTTSTRKNYFNVLSDNFKSWLLSRLLPGGGTVGQLLSKTSNTNYDVTWVNPSEFPELNFILAEEKGEAEGVATLDENSLIPLENLPQEVKVSAILKFNAEAFGTSYIYSSPGAELSSYPNLLIVSFEQTNVVSNIDFKIDSLPVIQLFNENLPLEIGQIQANKHYLLVLTDTGYNILGLPQDLKITKVMAQNNFIEEITSSPLVDFDENLLSGTEPGDGRIILPNDNITRTITVISKASWNRKTTTTTNIQGLHYLWLDNVRIDTSRIEEDSDNNTDGNTVCIDTFKHAGNGGEVYHTFSVGGDQFDITKIKLNVLSSVN